MRSAVSPASAFSHGRTVAGTVRTERDAWVFVVSVRAPPFRTVGWPLRRWPTSGERVSPECCSMSRRTPSSARSKSLEAAELIAMSCANEHAVRSCCFAELILDARAEEGLPWLRGQLRCSTSSATLVANGPEPRSASKCGDV